MAEQDTAVADVEAPAGGAESAAGSEKATGAEKVAVAETHDETPAVKVPGAQRIKLGISEGFEALEKKLTDEAQDDEGEGEPSKGEKAEKPKDDAKGEKPKTDAEKAAETGKGEKADSAKAGAGVFEAVDEKGNKYEVDWPEGHKIVLQVNGKAVEVDAPKLKTYAQLGVHANLRIRDLKDDVEARDARVADLETRLTQMDDEATSVLRVLCRDDEVGEEARAAALKELERADDPEIKQKRKDDADRARKARTADTDRAKAQREVGEAFWDRVGSEFDTALKEHPFLDADDRQGIFADFHGLYKTKYAELFQDATAAGKDADTASALADAEASKVLTEVALRDLMKALNDRYATRAGRSGKGAKPPVEDEDDDEAGDEAKAVKDAADHNARTTKKLDQGKQHRGVRGVGVSALPGAKEDKPTTVKGRKGKMVGLFDRLRTTLG